MPRIFPIQKRFEEPSQEKLQGCGGTFDVVNIEYIQTHWLKVVLENTGQAADRSDISPGPDTSTPVKYVVPGKYYLMLNVGKEEIARYQQQHGGWDEG